MRLGQDTGGIGGLNWAFACVNYFPCNKLIFSANLQGTPCVLPISVLGGPGDTAVTETDVGAHSLVEKADKLVPRKEQSGESRTEMGNPKAAQRRA